MGADYFHHHRHLRRANNDNGNGNNKAKSAHQLGVADDVVSVLAPVLGPAAPPAPAPAPPAPAPPAPAPPAPAPPAPAPPAPAPPANSPPRTTPPANSPTSPNPANPPVNNPADVPVNAPANTPSANGQTVPVVVVVGGSTITTVSTLPVGPAATAVPTDTVSTTRGPTTGLTTGNAPDTDPQKDTGTGSTPYASSGSGTLENNPSPSNTDAKALADGKAGSNGGAVAAGVITTLFVLVALVVILLRKRARARRDEQAIKWWFTRNRTSQSYGDNEAMLSGSPSRRSSFGTTVDHSNFAFHSDSFIPPPPPMAEIGRPKGTAPALVLDINADEKRFSIGSAGSHGSQFLVVHHRESLQPEAPQSVSACTQSFSFPKPPVGDTGSLNSTGSRVDSLIRQSYRASIIGPDDELIYLASPISPQLQIQNPLSPSAVHVESAPVNTDPFSDNNGNNNNNNNNPFEDPAPATAAGKLSEIELVRRPFVPQLQDELRVGVGESVRIVQTFDDGWALVERIFAASKPGIESEQGLIPVDCLRDPN